METRNILAAAIRNARERLGITQQALAESAGFASLQIVSAIETAQREVKAWELVRLARALQTSVDELLGLSDAAPVRVFWRRGSPGISAEREARLVQRAERMALLEEWNGLPPAEPLPDLAFAPDRASFADAARLAHRVGRALDLGSRPAASLLPILEERFGVKVFYEEMGEGESAACVRGPFGAAILVNAAQAPWRRSYSFAHELFHLVTWSAVERVWPADGEPEWSERLEQLADVFASNLLLPAEELGAQFEARVEEGGELDGMRVIELAREFGVSTSALAWRLVNLERSDAAWAKALLADEGFRRRDRLTMPHRWTHPPVPFPDRYLRLALLAYERGALSLSRLAEFLETSIGEANELLEGLELGEAAAAPAP
jgi:Zn-dependent peptidase ImmA (M78 family)/transcriptional regulator with XRE-family HTH domain